MACIVWKVLNSKQPYTEQDNHMTKRKMKIMSSKAMRIMPIDVLGKCPEDLSNKAYIIGKDLSIKNRLKEDILR
jgi:hypothetical protein